MPHVRTFNRSTAVENKIMQTKKKNRYKRQELNEWIGNKV